LLAIAMCLNARTAPVRLDALTLESYHAPRREPVALASLCPKHPAAVECEKAGVGQKTVGAGQPLAFALHKLGFDRRVWKIPLQYRAEDQPHFAIECD
jgi:hypothetical protein